MKTIKKILLCTMVLALLSGCVREQGSGLLDNLDGESSANLLDFSQEADEEVIPETVVETVTEKYYYFDYDPQEQTLPEDWQAYLPQFQVDTEEETPVESTDNSEEAPLLDLMGMTVEEVIGVYGQPVNQVKKIVQGQDKMIRELLIYMPYVDEADGESTGIYIYLVDDQVINYKIDEFNGLLPYMMEASLEF